MHNIESTSRCELLHFYLRQVVFFWYIYRASLFILYYDKQMQIISQIITFLHVSTLFCHPQAACNQYLAKLHHHHMSVVELGHLLTRSGLTYLEVSPEVFHDSFCQLRNSVSLSWAVCHEAFCLHVVSSSSCVPAVCLEPVLFLIPLQCVNLFCNLSKCILLFFS